MSNVKKEVKTQKFGKEAFLNAAENTKDRLVLQIVLEDGQTYTKTEADKIVKAWKQKEVK